MESVEDDGVAAVDRILKYDAVGRKNFNVNGSLQNSLLHKAVQNNNYKICKILVNLMLTLIYSILTIRIH